MFRRSPPQAEHARAGTRTARAMARPRETPVDDGQPSGVGSRRASPQRGRARPATPTPRRQQTVPIGRRKCGRALPATAALHHAAASPKRPTRPAAPGGEDRIGRRPDVRPWTGATLRWVRRCEATSGHASGAPTATARSRRVAACGKVPARRPALMRLRLFSARTPAPAPPRERDRCDGLLAGRRSGDRRDPGWTAPACPHRTRGWRMSTPPGAVKPPAAHDHPPPEARLAIRRRPRLARRHYSRAAHRALGGAGPWLFSMRTPAPAPTHRRGRCDGGCVAGTSTARRPASSPRAPSRARLPRGSPTSRPPRPAQPSRKVAGRWCARTGPCLPPRPLGRKTRTQTPRIPVWPESCCPQCRCRCERQRPERCPSIPRAAGVATSAEKEPVDRSWRLPPRNAGA